jgi:hypothetical protein
MPPAVAQAPTAHSSRALALTSRMRSASCGVVIEPSTTARSSGPGDSARVASGK